MGYEPEIWLPCDDNDDDVHDSKDDHLKQKLDNQLFGNLYSFFWFGSLCLEFLVLLLLFNRNLSYSSHMVTRLLFHCPPLLNFASKLPTSVAECESFLQLNRLFAQNVTLHMILKTVSSGQALERKS